MKNLDITKLSTVRGSNNLAIYSLGGEICTQILSIIPGLREGWEKDQNKETLKSHCPEYRKNVQQTLFSSF